MPNVEQNFDPKELNKSQKFVQLLQELQNPEGVKANEIMDKYAIDDRTLRRYITDFATIGIKVEKEGRSENRILKLDGNFQRAGIQLSLLEWVSLHFGRKLFNFLEGTGFAQDMNDALEKMSSIVGAHDLQLTQNMERMFHAVPEHSKRHGKEELIDVIDEVLTALLRKKVAKGWYVKPGQTMKQYLLEPYSVVTYRQGLYLFARDVNADIVKTFAIDRFQGFRRQSDTYEIPDDYHPENVLKHAFGIIGGTPKEIRLKFNRMTTPYIQERVWHHSQKDKINRDGSIELSMQVSLSPELKQWLMGFGAEVEIISPPELVEDIYKSHLKACQRIRPDIFRKLQDDGVDFFAEQRRRE